MKSLFYRAALILLTVCLLAASACAEGSGTFDYIKLKEYVHTNPINAACIYQFEEDRFDKNWEARAYFGGKQAFVILKTEGSFSGRVDGFYLEVDGSINPTGQSESVIADFYIDNGALYSFDLTQSMAVYGSPRIYITSELSDFLTDFSNAEFVYMRLYAGAELVDEETFTVDMCEKFGEHLAFNLTLDPSGCYSEAGRENAAQAANNYRLERLINGPMLFDDLPNGSQDEATGQWNAHTIAQNGDIGLVLCIFANQNCTVDWFYIHCARAVGDRAVACESVKFLMDDGMVYSFDLSGLMEKLGTTGISLWEETRDFANALLETEQLSIRAVFEGKTFDVDFDRNMYSPFRKMLERCMAVHAFECYNEAGLNLCKQMHENSYCVQSVY